MALGVSFLVDWLNVPGMEGSRLWYVAIPVFFLVPALEVRGLLDRVEITEAPPGLPVLRAPGSPVPLLRPVRPATPQREPVNR